ncbi:MAG: 50S ribosomal protein L20 [Mediterraneibacter gnavus]
MQNICKRLHICLRRKKERKRQMRHTTDASMQLQMNGLSCNKFMGLKVAGVDINRKMLAELAVVKVATLAELAKSSLLIERQKR